MTIGNFQPSMNMTQRMNPDAYAQQYANSKGISLQEAKAELKEKYGDPDKNMGPIFGNPMQQAENSYIDFTGLNDSDFGMNMDSGRGFFQRFLDLFRGGNGPQNPGDPQPHLNNPWGGQQDGPQKPGDPQFQFFG